MTERANDRTAIGSSQLWPELYSGYPWWLMLLPWVAPFPIAFAAIALLKRHCQRKDLRRITPANVWGAESPNA